MTLTSISIRNCCGEEREVVRERENISRAEKISYKPATWIFQYYCGEEN